MQLIIKNTWNTNTLGGDTTYLFLVYTHKKKKKSQPSLYSYPYANVVFKASLKGSIPLVENHMLFSSNS